MITVHLILCLVVRLSNLRLVVLCHLVRNDKIKIVNRVSTFQNSHHFSGLIADYRSKQKNIGSFLLTPPPPVPTDLTPLHTIMDMKSNK